MNLHVTLSDPIHQKLAMAQAKYGFVPDQLINKLVADFLQDLEDGEDAIKILAENNPKISLDNVIAENGLAG